MPIYVLKHLKQDEWPLVCDRLRILGVDLGLALYANETGIQIKFR